MLSEDGSIRTANISVAPALKIYRKKLKIIALISLIAGAVGLITYIVLSAIETDGGETPRWLDIFLIFAVPFTLGLIGFITIIRLGKRETAEERTSGCRFFADCFIYTSKSASELTETVEKIAYADAALKCENENYGYIFVLRKGLFVFSKEGLEKAELNAIFKNLKHPTVGETAELKNYEKNN